MPDQCHESEWLTRKKRIDTRLKALGWTIVPFSTATPLFAYTKHAVEEFPTDTGPADYALCVNGRILGIVEAKKLSLGPQNVLVQAERYSRGAVSNPLSFGQFRVPFLYSTNGEVIWFHDIRHKLNVSRKIAHLPTPAALEEMLAHQFDDACAKLSQLPNAQPGIRPYQVEANTAVEQAIRGRKRQMLVAMATGTGKTFTTVKANVVFFTKGAPTKTVWIYDARTNVPGITKKDRPLTEEHFKGFEQCFGADQLGRARRRAADSPDDRSREFKIAEVRERQFKLDGFKWLKEDSLEDADDLFDPDELAGEAIGELQGAVEELNEILALLANGAK
jgi:hypothetical protein